MSPEPMLIDKPVLNVEDAKQFLIEIAMGAHTVTTVTGFEKPLMFSHLVAWDKRQYSSLRNAVNFVQRHVIKTRCTIQIYCDHGLIVEFDPLRTTYQPGAEANVTHWKPLAHKRYENTALRAFVCHVLQIAGEREYTHGGNSSS